VWRRATPFEEALREVRSAIRFHLETLGLEDLGSRLSGARRRADRVSRSRLNCCLVVHNDDGVLGRSAA